MSFEEHLKEYQKLMLTHFLKKINLRLYRTQPTKCFVCLRDINLNDKRECFYDTDFYEFMELNQVYFNKF
jgi:hypothetical protein